MNSLPIGNRRILRHYYTQIYYRFGHDFTTTKAYKD